jgi:ribA/ribD-fused uncharacterized protein
MIGSFSGEFRFLSNFWQEPGLSDRLWGYPSMEHYFQAMKTLDQGERAKIRAASTPAQAKRRGRNVVLRDNWEEIKDEVMRVGLEHKFAVGTQLAEKLLDTGNEELVEGNYWHDNVWGNCTCVNCREIKGQNLLGRLLMGWRYELLTGGGD